MTNQERSGDVIYQALYDEDDPYGAAHNLAAEGLLMPDLPEPNITNDGWVDWGDGEASFHPTKGLWSYDDGCMVPVSPDNLRDVALIYLAAAKYAEENA